MPPENSCGYCCRRAVGLRDADHVEHLEHSGVAAFFDDLVVRRYGLGQLAADRVHRVQRGHRVLEDHRDPLPRSRRNSLLRHRQQVRVRGTAPSPVICAFFGSRPITAIDDTDLPDPDSPTMPSTSPARRSNETSADGVHHAVVGREVDGQVLDREGGRRRACRGRLGEQVGRASIVMRAPCSAGGRGRRAGRRR